MLLYPFKYSRQFSEFLYPYKYDKIEFYSLVCWSKKTLCRFQWEVDFREGEGLIVLKVNHFGEKKCMSGST